MSHPGRILTLATDERGAVLVIFALFAPVAILLAAFAIDTGNWFLHKRHLQVQADSAALAAVQEFQPCATNDSIYETAGQYGGAASIETPEGTKAARTPLYNLQIGGTLSSNIHGRINFQTYYGQRTPVDSSASTSPPCAGEMVDVKLTETNLPWYWRAFSSVPYINAHARVEIRQESVTSGKSLIPVALADANPRSAAACFVNEETGAIIASTPLVKQPGSSGLAVWESSPTQVEINTPGVAVRVALSGSTGPTSCTDPQATVYDSSGSKVGILHIQGWSGNGIGGDGGTGNPKPIAREVTLLPGTCSDAYFSAKASCSLGVEATIDGVTNLTAGVKVKAEVAGTSYPLSYSAGKWTGSGLSVAANAGSIPVNLNVTDTAMQSLKTKSVTFSAIQRSYTAGANSGPIQSAGVFEHGVGDANSFRRCESGYTGCKHELVVRIGTAGLENATSPNTPPIEFPVKEGIKNCPTGSNFKQRLAKGCDAAYAVNTGAACSTSAPVITCLELESGVKANDFAAGLNQRILGDEKASLCTSPNHWSMFPNLPKNDPRIVTIVVIPFGTTSGDKPIESFATFYITGWAGEGNGFRNPCQGNGDDPAQSGQMVGHFIKYINTTDTGGGGSTICEPNALGQCVAVLTR